MNPTDTILIVHVDTDDGFSCDVATDWLEGDGGQQVTPCTRGSCDKHDDIPKMVMTVNDSLALRRRLLDFLIDYPGWHRDVLPSFFDRVTEALVRVNRDFGTQHAKSGVRHKQRRVAS
jgi:hypothetical protein